MFDFSTVITTLHLSFWIELRTEKQIKEDMDFDLACFDFMVEAANVKKIKSDRMNEKRWECLRSRSGKETSRRG